MSFENRYGLLDRALHRLAFATVAAQVGAADLEARWFRRELEDVAVDRPVLVTALPRAGTTILLELLVATGVFGSHTYRDMPFVLCPMLWQRLSGRIRRGGAKQERAHADGIEIGIDSPEAFEEIVWKAFWKERYRAAVIEPWERCDRREFVEFLNAHLRRIVALRRRELPTVRRYVSKNNLNVARVPALWQALPDALVVVPFRDPVQHAASLLAQHRRFCAMHDADPFARRYMAAIGHHDFGRNLKPVDFDGWTGTPHARDPMQLGFWLAYWIATYRHVLRHSDDPRLSLVSFEALPGRAPLPALASFLAIDAAELEAPSHILKHARPHEVPLDDVPPALLDEARSLHALLSRRCLAPS